jgi:hypothetical protein
MARPPANNLLCSPACRVYEPAQAALGYESRSWINALEKTCSAAAGGIRIAFSGRVQHRAKPASKNVICGRISILPRPLTW